MKKLYRSRTDRVIAGVCGGVAEHFQMDVTIIRLLWVLITFAGGAGVLAYIVAAIVIPEKRGFGEAHRFAPGDSVTGTAEANGELGGGSESHRTGGSESYRTENGGSECRRYRNGRDSTRILGIILVSLGGVFLLRNLIPWHFEIYWPVILIIIGAAFLAGGLNRGAGR